MDISRDDAKGLDIQYVVRWLWHPTNKGGLVTQRTIKKRVDVSDRPRVAYRDVHDGCQRLKPAPFNSGVSFVANL
jgi:hypothetical protein